MYKSRLLSYEAVSEATNTVNMAITKEDKMKRIVTLATTFALSFGLMGPLVSADSDGDHDRSNARRLAHHQRVERERLTRQQRRERERAKESDVSRRRVAKV